MNAKGLAPYTMDELNARIDEAEAEFAAGKEYLLKQRISE